MIEQFHFFCDEAGTTQDQYLVVSGLAVSAVNLDPINLEVERLRSDLNMLAELKWQKVTNQKESQYRRFVDFIFCLLEARKMAFHCLIVPYSRFDHKILNNNDRNLSLHKIYYQLVLHRFCRYYGVHGRLVVQPDMSCVPFCGESACRVLNRGIRKHQGIKSDPVVGVVPIDSANSNILQLNDLLLGAICSHRNGRHLNAGGRESKRRMAEYVLKRAGVFSYGVDTPPHGPRHFTVWNFRSPLLK